jgi:hypothetical protein
MPLDDALRGAVEQVPGIEGAWVAGDLGSAQAPIYVVVIGSMAVEGIDGVFDRSRVALVPIAGAGRVELAYFRPSEWRTRMTSLDRFATSLLTEPRIELISFAERDP